jgi:hypothetical protein
MGRTVSSSHPIRMSIIFEHYKQLKEIENEIMGKNPVSRKLFIIFLRYYHYGR